MALDSLLRDYVDNCILVRKIAKLFAVVGISPNFLSVASLVFAVLAGLFFFFAGNAPRLPFNPILLLAGVFVCLSAFLDGIDGVLAREIGNANKKGDFLDHVLDRYSDVFIIVGIILGGYVHPRWEIGVIAIIGVLLSSYMGTQAQAVGLSRVYGGLIGRADRLLIIIVATLLNLIYPYSIPASGLLSFSFLGWTIVIFAVLCNVTALQRFFYAWKRI
ncbi:MAG TPA: CDP-alcohol phosphatidyltransferase family protein [Methanophagales archaeon]|nr:CDP-alcohol phosphatidyltransferase family protein [Methanophagales archaeon]